MEWKATIAAMEAALAKREALDETLAQREAKITYLEKEIKENEEHNSKLGDRVARFQDMLFGMKVWGSN